MNTFKFSSTFKICLLTVLTGVLLSVSAFAQEAVDITKSVNITSDQLNILALTDNNIATNSRGTDVTITIDSQEPMGGLYILYNDIPSPGMMNGQTDIAQNRFFHEYIALNGETSVTVTYETTDICDLFVFSQGTLPSWVQVWKKANDKTDLLLYATHSDDDQLFFAGLLPYYAGYKKINVAVAYFTNHYDTYNRTHELLNGLWTCGVTNYPIISPFPDGYSESVEGAEQYLASKGYTHENILAYQHHILNTYKPLVVVVHDINGEYGHGAHKLSGRSLIEAAETASETDYVPQKIYVHLYKENPLELPIDTPLDCFEGKTPFQVSQEAFQHHKSQHWTWFYKWIYGKNTPITSSTQIRTYNPRFFGLYYTSVGNDVNGNDMLENIETYEEKAIREEQERKAEAERLKKRQEEENRLAEEKRLAEEATLKAEQEAEQKRKTRTMVTLILSFIIGAVTVLFVNKKHKNKK